MALAFTLNLYLKAESLLTTLSSPYGLIKVTVSDYDGLLSYRANYGDKEVIQASILGLRFAKQHSLDADLHIIGSVERISDATWE